MKRCILVTGYTVNTEYLTKVLYVFEKNGNIESKKKKKCFNQFSELFKKNLLPATLTYMHFKVLTIFSLHGLFGIYS